MDRREAIKTMGAFALVPVVGTASLSRSDRALPTDGADKIEWEVIRFSKWNVTHDNHYFPDIKKPSIIEMSYVTINHRRIVGAELRAWQYHVYLTHRDNKCIEQEKAEFLQTASQHEEQFGGFTRKVHVVVIDDDGTEIADGLFAAWKIKSEE